MEGKVVPLLGPEPKLISDEELDKLLAQEGITEAELQASAQQAFERHFGRY